MSLLSGGSASSSDIDAALSHLTTGSELSSADVALMDVNDDGVLGAADVLAIARKASGSLADDAAAPALLSIQPGTALIGDAITLTRDDETARPVRIAVGDAMVDAHRTGIGTFRITLPPVAVDGERPVRVLIDRLASNALSVDIRTGSIIDIAAATDSHTNSAVEIVARGADTSTSVEARSLDDDAAPSAWVPHPASFVNGHASITGLLTDTGPVQVRLRSPASQPVEVRRVRPVTVTPQLPAGGPGAGSPQVFGTTTVSVGNNVAVSVNLHVGPTTVCAGSSGTASLAALVSADADTAVVDSRSTALWLCALAAFVPIQRSTRIADARRDDSAFDALTAAVSAAATAGVPLDALPTHPTIVPHLIAGSRVFAATALRAP